MLRALCTLSLLLLAPSFASAALLPTFESPLEINVSPEHPHPGDQVTLTVGDPAKELGITAYIWSVNGAVVDQGIDHSSISVTAGALGASDTVRVVAVENGSARSEAVTIIRPASVDIIWEGDTYTPPVYIGRPLPNGQSSLTIMAIPHLFQNGVEIKPGTLVYSWRMNNAPLQKQSGYGKSSATVTPPRFGAAFTIRAIVSTPDGSVVAENSVVIQPQVPALLVYEDAPLLGMRFEKAERDLFSFTGEEVSFVLYPLFASNPDALSYAWKLDTVPFVVDPDRPRAATFRKVGSGSGTHTVSVSAENAKKFLENAIASFQLTF